jgi:catechol 2,3-dioxygenase-like lactoylglutathione lyase family enzyme
VKGLREKKPVYHRVVLLVKDIEKSKSFYNIVLGQKIVLDFGRYVEFEGGLGIWEKAYALNLIFEDGKSAVEVGGNTAELYFEFDDLDGLYEELEGKTTVIHSIREPPWGQRAFRVYDPDGHIIEFGESMANVVLRLYNEGLSLEEISKKSMMPMDFIQTAISKQ